MRCNLPPPCMWPAGNAFIEAAEHVLLVGPVGVGKSFLAQALGYAALKADRSVRFTRADDYFRDLAHARLDGTLEKTFRSYLTPDLLILDDLGLTALDLARSQDFYELVVAKHRSSSFVITSNRSVEEWLSLFADPMLGNSAFGQQRLPGGDRGPELPAPVSPQCSASTERKEAEDRVGIGLARRGPRPSPGKTNQEFCQNRSGRKINRKLQRGFGIAAKRGLMLVNDKDAAGYERGRPDQPGARRSLMRFWDSSAIVPLLIGEETTSGRLRLQEIDPPIVTWWTHA